MYFYATGLMLHQLDFEQVGEKQQDSMKRSPSMPSENTLRKMSIPLLAEHCIRELEVYRRGGPSNDQYSLELFYRALIQRDSLAWEVIQHCFGPIMYRWIRDHNLREVACRF